MRLKIIHMHKITRNCLLHCDYIGLNLIEFCKMWMYVVHNCVFFCNSIMQRRSFSVFHRLYLCHCKCILKSKLNVFVFQIPSNQYLYVYQKYCIRFGWLKNNIYCYTLWCSITWNFIVNSFSNQILQWHHFRDILMIHSFFFWWTHNNIQTCSHISVLQL